MDWPMAAMVGLFVVFAVVFVVMWSAGEVVGSVTGYASTRFMSDRSVRLTVKRVAPSGSRPQPAVSLQVRVFMAASMQRLNSYEAKKLADAIDEMVNGGNPPVKVFSGYTLEFIPGQEIGVTTDIGTDTSNVITACLDYADAHKLAEFLRIAASPGRTVTEARLNLRKSRPTV